MPLIANWERHKRGESITNLIRAQRCAQVKNMMKSDDVENTTERLGVENGTNAKTHTSEIKQVSEYATNEQERAKERTKAEGNQYEGKEAFPDHQTGQARDKAAEKINEAEAWEEVESQRATERRRATQNNDLAECPNLDELDKGRTDEKVAEKVGVSKNTYRNGKKVKEIATGERDACRETNENVQTERNPLGFITQRQVYGCTPAIAA